MTNHSITLHILTYTGETVRVIPGFDSVDSAVATGDALTARTDLYYRTFAEPLSDSDTFMVTVRFREHASDRWKEVNCADADEALEWAKEFVDEAFEDSEARIGDTIHVWRIGDDVEVEVASHY